jgi:hypothetical protein
MDINKRSAAYDTPPTIQELQDAVEAALSADSPLAALGMTVGS